MRDRSRPPCGFTLIEVVVALLVLEVSVLGTFGVLILASRATRNAARIERAVADAEGVLDSLAGVESPTSGARPSGDAEVRWDVGTDGTTVVRVLATGDSVLFEATTWIAR